MFTFVAELCVEGTLILIYTFDQNCYIGLAIATAEAASCLFAWTHSAAYFFFRMLLSSTSSSSCLASSLTCDRSPQQKPLAARTLIKHAKR